MLSIHRLLLSVLYRLALAYWFLFRPTACGSYVAVWSCDRLLVIKNSYKASWTFPAGGKGNQETYSQAAVRELREEVGLDCTPEQFSTELYFQSSSEYKKDNCAVFELELDHRPKVEIDNLEVVEAKWLSLDDVLAKRSQLTCIAAQYIDWKRDQLLDASAPNQEVPAALQT